MSSVTLDAVTLSKLQAPGPVVEVRDEAGKLVGKFVKAVDPERLKVLKAIVGEENWPSDEELDRIIREEPTYSTEQVMERLRRLSK